MPDIVRLSYPFSVRNGIKNQFCKRNEKAGKKWLRKFISRHPQISVRTAEWLTLSRASGLTPESVAQLFINLRTRNGYHSTYSCKTLQLWQSRHHYFTAQTHENIKTESKRQISSLQSAERGSLVTVVNCVSPTGRFTPPLLVFPRKNMKQELMNGTPPASIHTCHPSVWLQSEIFSPVVPSFHQTYTADKRRSCYLSTGRALSTHTRNLEVITLARENHVDIIGLPSHSSHKM